MSKQLPIGDVLSVTTGRLVSRDHISGVYRVCDYMTGEPNFTHALQRVSEECRLRIFEQHPWLEEIKVPDWDEPTKEIVYSWLDEIEAHYGTTVSLEPLAAEDHTSIDPISELLMIKPDANIIAVTVDEDDGS